MLEKHLSIQTKNSKSGYVLTMNLCLTFEDSGKGTFSILDISTSNASPGFTLEGRELEELIELLKMSRLL